MILQYFLSSNTQQFQIGFDDKNLFSNNLKICKMSHWSNAEIIFLACFAG